VALSPIVPAALAVGLVVFGVGLAVWGVRAIAARRRESAVGTLVAIDAGRPAVLRSSRYRIQGRPDALRELPDGRWVPVETKSRRSPRGGPTRSHLVQVWAYCVLVEEETGRSPPFAIVRYSDQEYRVPWTSESRHELLRLRAELLRPYDGRATPSTARCARCRWFPTCDARVT
jgi:CRISPR-associated exonuclease Cas4